MHSQRPTSAKKIDLNELLLPKILTEVSISQQKASFRCSELLSETSALKGTPRCQSLTNRSLSHNYSGQSSFSTWLEKQSHVASNQDGLCLPCHFSRTFYQGITTQACHFLDAFENLMNRTTKCWSLQLKPSIHKMGTAVSND